MNGNTQHLSFLVFHGQAAKQQIVMSQFSSECEQDSLCRLQRDCVKLFRTSLVFRLFYQRWRCEKAPCLSYSLLWGLSRVDFCAGCFGAAQLLNTTGLICLLQVNSWNFKSGTRGPYAHTHNTYSCQGFSYIPSGAVARFNEQ